MYNLLVIEDVADVNAMLCEFFTHAGYNVLSAKDGAEGLAKFQSSDIDFIDEQKIAKFVDQQFNLTVKEYGLLRVPH